MPDPFGQEKIFSTKFNIDITPAGFVYLFEPIFHFGSSTLRMTVFTKFPHSQWCSTGLRDRPTLVSPFRKRPPKCTRSTDAALCG